MNWFASLLADTWRNWSQWKLFDTWPQCGSGHSHVSWDSSCLWHEMIYKHMPLKDSRSLRKRDFQFEQMTWNPLTIKPECLSGLRRIQGWSPNLNWGRGLSITLQRQLHRDVCLFFYTLIFGRPRTLRCSHDLSTAALWDNKWELSEWTHSVSVHGTALCQNLTWLTHEKRLCRCTLTSILLTKISICKSLRQLETQSRANDWTTDHFFLSCTVQNCLL